MRKHLTPNDLAATFDAFNRHDIDGVMALFADDGVLYTAAGTDLFGVKIEGTDTAVHRGETQRADLFTLRDGEIVVSQALRKQRPVTA